MFGVSISIDQRHMWMHWVRAGWGSQFRLGVGALSHRGPSCGPSASTRVGFFPPPYRDAALSLLPHSGLCAPSSNAIGPLIPFCITRQASSGSAGLCTSWGVKRRQTKPRCVGVVVLLSPHRSLQRSEDTIGEQRVMVAGVCGVNTIESTGRSTDPWTDRSQPTQAGRQTRPNPMAAPNPCRSAKAAPVARGGIAA